MKNPINRRDHFVSCFFNTAYKYFLQTFFMTVNTTYTYVSLDFLDVVKSFKFL